jgi:hypothetical protein
MTIIKVFFFFIIIMLEIKKERKCCYNWLKSGLLILVNKKILFLFSIKIDPIFDCSL